MISDGAGYNTWVATSMYQGRWEAATGRSRQIYDQEGWLHFGCATYPLSLADKPAGTNRQDPKLVYDPAKAWDPVKGYDWLRTTATDSAAAGTAMATGVKTYNNAINWSDEDRPLEPALPQLAKARGKSVGIVTSVQWSHATPATLGGARVPDRDDYEAIARQMLHSYWLDVIMGAGHPEYDHDGRPVEKGKQYRYVGGDEIWKALEAARAKPDGTYQGFRPVVTREEFAALCSGNPPRKVVGTAPVATTLQVARSGGAPNDPPFDDPLIDSVPNLAMMTEGALNILDDNPRGFFLMVEGGAVDWANHARHLGRMIEEQIDFLQAVEVVVRWVEKHSNWSETLVIITADHETGLLWGPNSAEKPFEPLGDRGAGQMPLAYYNSKGHSNSLVPLMARGFAAERFRQEIVGEDPRYGAYVDNTAIFRVIAQALGLDRSLSEQAEPRMPLVEGLPFHWEFSAQTIRFMGIDAR